MASKIETIVYTGNVTIVQSIDTTTIQNIDVLDALHKFAGDIRKTVLLGIVPPSPSREEAFSSLFGSWAETGDEDKNLQEIYNQRLVSSSTPLDEE